MNTETSATCKGEWGARDKAACVKPKNVQQVSDQLEVVTIYDLVDGNHFLRRLAELLPWKQLAKPFEDCFKGGKEYGPRGYPVSMLLRMTVLSYLYHLSDAETEQYVRESNPARLFVGLGLLQPVPDETTLCRFRRRVVKSGKSAWLSALFNEVLSVAQRRGIELGRVQILDAVHTQANVDKGKEERKKREAERNGEKPPPPQDPDASTGCKGTQKKRDPETNKIVEEKKWFFGYKSHVSLNQKTGLVTSVTVSTGKDADCNAAPFLLKEDIGKGVPITVLTADKAYDDIDLHLLCGKHEIFNAVALRKTRFNQKSAVNRKKWEDHAKQPFYKKALGLRYKIEQKFGEAKRYHGVRTCRYRGILAFAFQSIMTFLCMNLKRMVKLLPA